MRKAMLIGVLLAMSGCTWQTSVAKCDPPTPPEGQKDAVELNVALSLDRIRIGTCIRE